MGLQKIWEKWNFRTECTSKKQREEKKVEEKTILELLSSRSKESDSPLLRAYMKLVEKAHLMR